MKQGKPARKYSQAARVHDIIRLIESRHGMSIDDLAEETGVTRRTIHRDLNAIHDAGYPLVSEREGTRKVFRFIARFKDIPPISLTIQELATLYFLRSQADILQVMPFTDELDSIFRKVNSVLPPRYAAHLERISGVALPLLQGRYDYSMQVGLLKTLRDALVFQFALTVLYHASGRQEPEMYRFDPYTLAYYKGGLYLIGYAHNRGAVRTFSIERIKSVTVEKDRFELPADYRPDELLHDAFGIVAEEAMNVRIRFSSVVANTVRGRLWHQGQSIEELPDGGIELVFTAGGKLEIVSWVLSYGEYAEVIEPAELRAMVARAVRGMQGKYG